MEPFNLGTGEGYSVEDVITAFEQTEGVRAYRCVGPRRPGDAPVSYADASQANGKLGLRATRTLAQMCGDAWRWQP